MKIKFRIIHLTVIASIISSFLSPLSILASYDQSSAQNYLLSHQSNPWVTMALAATNTDSVPSDYLKTISGDSAIDYEAPILAIAALGQNPASFGEYDYIAKLKSFYTQSQIGVPTALNDDYFGVLALISAGQPANDQIISDSKNYILSHQNSDGGWSWTTNGSSDSNDTAAAIMALTAGGVPADDSHVQNGIDYLKSTQGTDGGFMYDLSSDTTDSSSTSWVVWALNALGISPSSWTKGDNTPLSYLSSYQTDNGYFKWKASDTTEPAPVVTADAVIALAGKTIPINPVSTSPTQTFSFRIEGSDQTVCKGRAAGPTAMDIVKNASLSCGFTYNIQSTSYGPYLNKINDDSASGTSGWSYFVNSLSPSVGAADYALQPNDEVLWAFGGWNLQPTRTSLSSGQITSGQSLTVNAESFSENAWHPLADADIFYGALTAKTDNNGQVTISPIDGYYKIYAQKSDFVRSDTQSLVVGQPQNSMVTLSANVATGDIKGDATVTPDLIAFTVSPPSLDFGTLASGSNVAKTLNFRNVGSTNLKIQAQTSGDTLFVDYLSLAGASWRSFGLDLPAAGITATQAAIKTPSNVKLSAGQKSGQIIFWANPN